MSELTRDAAKVKATLEETPDGRVIAKKGCTLVCPTRFRDKRLVTIGNEVYVLGIFMLVLDQKYYAVNITTAMMRIEPSNINNIYLDEKEHIEFVFEPGDTLFANVDLVVNGKLLYYIFDELISKGNVPVFFNYIDLGNLFESAQKFGGKKLASSPAIMRMLLSFLARSPDDLNVFFRQYKGRDDVSKVRYIPLYSTTHGANNTTARLIGANFSDNLTSALVNPSDEEQDIEHILRM